ncbi:phosphotriesterase [candidate division KSB1 bacterium]|nr:phosphotriesterase [candidate division KSB1 bacterium]
MYCASDKGIIMTVNGSLPATEMGITLTHEHLLVDFIGADSTGYHRWNREEVVEKVLPFLLEIKKYDVKTFVECTPAYLGRDPILLQNLSEKSGLNILTNTGFYGAMQNKFLPDFVQTESPEELAVRWIQEWKNGIEDTGIKPGFIKIAVDRDAEISPIHQKLIRAAAKTHLKTGLTIASHTGPEAPAFQQLAILEEEGVAPEAFIWVHAQRGTDSAHVVAAQKGAWISLDNVKADSIQIQKYMKSILNLKKNNLLERLLISHDAGWYRVGEPEGGSFRPFTDIFMHLIPALKEKGITDDDIQQIMVKNPAQAFQIKIRKLMKPKSVN